MIQPEHLLDEILSQAVTADPLQPSYYEEHLCCRLCPLCHHHQVSSLGHDDSLLALLTAGNPAYNIGTIKNFIINDQPCKCAATPL